MNRRKLFTALGIVAGSLLVTLGVFASNDWFPKTDPMSGQKFGWFGKKLPKNYTASAWNPIPPPSPTPQLSKEYIYAGSRMLAVEDANAVSAPPADIAIWRPSSGYWWVMGQTGSAQTASEWGTSGDIPVPGDFDGDGKTDFAVWRPGSGDWWVFYSATSTADQINWGVSGDIPIAADFDGDGRSDLGIVRADPVNHELDWYVDLSGGGPFSHTWGLDTDKPAAADYDGDGKADLATYRGSTDEFWWIRSSDSQTGYVDLGYNGDVVVSSDYDGDGKAD
ncbi:MAG TPA: VCBS repeat-containing protein, partial [Terriglobia bacterium]|nr:VCBS repeat-containing protein [Terriglobia bacterium]